MINKTSSSGGSSISITLKWNCWPVRTVLHENSPACDVAAGSSGEHVWGGRDAHWLHQVIKENRRAELQEGDVIVRGKLVVLWVEEDPTDQSDGCSVAPRGHHTHSHISTPSASIWVSADTQCMNKEHTHQRSNWGFYLISYLMASESWKQWAAEMSQRLETRVAPQTWP